MNAATIAKLAAYHARVRRRRRVRSQERRVCSADMLRYSPPEVPWTAEERARFDRLYETFRADLDLLRAMGD